MILYHVFCMNDAITIKSYNLIMIAIYNFIESACVIAVMHAKKIIYIKYTNYISIVFIIWKMYILKKNK